MRAFLLTVVGLSVSGVIAGCDWAQTSTGSAPGKSTVTVTFNHEEFERDRADYRRRAQEQLSQLDDRLRDLNEKAKAAAGDAKIQLDAEVARQQANLEKARGELKEVDAATAEKWAEVKARSSAAFDDLKKGLENAWSRFMLTAVENGGAGIVSRRLKVVARQEARWKVRRYERSSYLLHLRREAQECAPIWKYGRKFVGEC